jgi:hypothetical protein
MVFVVPTPLAADARDVRRGNCSGPYLCVWYLVVSDRNCSCSKYNFAFLSGLLQSCRSHYSKEVDLRLYLLGM